MRLAISAAAVSVGLLASAAVAEADTICVQMPAGSACDSSHTKLQDAMNDAATPVGVRDTIRIGPTTLNEAGVFQPNAAQNPVDIVGSGQAAGGTVMRSTTAASPLRLTAGSTVSQMRFVLPGDKGNAPAGLDLEQADASDVTVVAEPGPTGGTGIVMRATSAIRRVTVQMASAPSQTYAVSIAGAGTHTIEDSVLTASSLLNVAGTTGENTMVVRRVRNTGRCANCLYLLRGTLDISDSLFQVANEGSAVWAQPGTTATARNMTVLGEGGTNTSAFRAHGSGVADVRDSIILGVPYVLYTFDSGHLSIDYSDFDPDKLQKVGVAGLITRGSHNVNVDPAFVNPGAGDYRLASGSPVAERGSPGEGASPFDLGGGPRLADANGDGQAVLDMGAYEYAGAPYTLPPVQNTPPEGPGGGGGGGGVLMGPQMTLGAKTATLDSKRRLKVKVTCQPSESGTCNGTLALVTQKKYRPKPGKKAVLIKLGGGKFKSIPGGRTATVTVKLSTANAALVRRLKKVKVNASMVAVWGIGGEPRTSTGTLTVKPAAKKR